MCRGTMTVPPLNNTGSTLTPVPAGAKERCDRDGHVVTLEVDHREHVDHVPGEVAVGQHDSSGCPRGARGVGEHAQVIEPDDLVEWNIGGVRDEGLVVDVRVGRRADQTPERTSDGSVMPVVECSTTTTGAYPSSNSPITARSS